MMFDIEAVSEALPERAIFWLAETGSTMNDAARLAESGCPSGAVVGAETQFAGQGRHGHGWHSEAGAGLYFSLILRLDLPPEQTPMVTMALGLAAAEAMTQVAGLATDLRWPNDVLIGGRKVSGILVQQNGGALVCGLGINVNQAQFPPDIAEIATSLRIASGREISRERLLIELLPAIDRYLAILATEGKEAVLRLFSHASSFVSGRRVVVDQSGAVLRGTTAGLDADGFLILQQDDGTRTLILAGGVRPV